MPVIFYSYEERVEQKEIQYEEGETLRDLFQRMVEDEGLEDELDYLPNIDDLVVVLKKNPTKRVSPDDKIERIIQENKSDSLQLLVVYPTDAGGALLQFQFPNGECHFSNFFNINDLLQNYIQIYLKKLSIQQQIVVRVNGELSTPKKQFQKMSIKNILNEIKGKRIFIQIIQKSRVSKEEVEKSAQKKENKVNKKEGKEKIKQVKDRSEGKNKRESPQRAVSPHRAMIQSNSQAKMSEKSISMKEQKYPKQQIALQPMKSMPNVMKKEQEKYQLSFQFQSINSDGKRSLTFEVSPAETMLEILPKLLKQMAEAGFDWDIRWQDFKSKLKIFYGNAEYNKLQKKFRQVLGSVDSNSIFSFKIRRHYEGG